MLHRVAWRCSALASVDGLFGEHLRCESACWIARNVRRRVFRATGVLLAISGTFEGDRRIQRSYCDDDGDC